MYLLSPNAPMRSRNNVWRCASSAGFSSLKVFAWRSAIAPVRLALLPSFVRCSVRASRCMMRRSVVMRSRMFGRCNLITASRPSGSTQPCTCPIDAADSGLSSKLLKICAGARPRSLRIMARAVSPSKGGTSSRQRAHASGSGAGNMLGDEAISWPSLTNVGRGSRTHRRHHRPRPAPTVARRVASRPLASRSTTLTTSTK